MTDTNPTPNPQPTPAPAPAPSPAPAPAPAPEPAPASDELKPLTDAEMESMTTEEITAHAEKLEDQVKAAKKQTPDEIRANQIQRAKNAQEKAFSQTTPQDSPAAPAAEKQIAQADLVTLGRSSFDIGSKEQQLLQEAVEQGRIKTYAEGFEHVGVKAELEAIKADSDATTVIDENDTEENQLQTKKEAVAQARETGDIPDDPKVQAAIVEDNISRMSALN